MRRRKVADGIYHLQADTNKELALTFMRFQEHYESPKFRNKVFSVGEFKDWYRTEYGSFSYVADWSGFNIPSYILNPFQAGLFHPLTRAEKALLRLIDKIAHPFYIIGTSKESPTDVHHELAHALYHL